MMVLNETVNICNPSRTKNIFVRYYMNHIFDMLEAPPSCPILKSSVFNFTVAHKDMQKNDFEHVPQFTKSFKGQSSMVNFSAILMTVIEKKRVEMFSMIEVSRVTVV
jgi:hypothetical protein